MCQFDTFFYLTASPFPKLVMDTVEKFLTQVRQGVQNGIIVPLLSRPCPCLAVPASPAWIHLTRVTVTPLTAGAGGLPIAIDYMIVQSSLEITRLFGGVYVYSPFYVYPDFSKKSRSQCHAPASRIHSRISHAMQRRGPEYRLFVSFDRDLSAQLISGGRKSSSKSRL